MTVLSDLPVELLEHILSFLPLDAWKQASLVCRQWTTVCSSRKCMENVLLRVETYEQGEDEIRSRLLSPGARKYRHVLFKSDNDDSDLLPAILDRSKNTLESLRIASYYEGCLQVSIEYLKRLFECITMLKELRIQTMVDYEDDEIAVPAKIQLAKMPHLRVLYLEYGSLEASCFDWREIAPNLKHLYMPHNSTATDFYGLMRFYSQKLRSLGIALGSEKYCCVGEKNVNFPHVRQLSVSGWTENDLVRTTQLYKSFTNLRELSLGHYVLPESLKMIVNSFPSLVTLRLYDAMPDDGLQTISKLPNLKDLFIFRVTLNHTQLTQADCFKKLEQLALKYVDVTEVDEFFALIHLKMPNLTSLEITETEEHQAAAVCKYLTNLQRLSIAWDDENNLRELFGQLSRLTQLLELRLYGICKQSEFSWTWFSRCPTVCLLRISLDQLTKFCSVAGSAKEWQAFTESFPSLAKFEIARCQLPSATVDSIRSQLPCCDVRHISNRKPFQVDSIDATLQFSSCI